MNKGYDKPLAERLEDFLLYHKRGDGECNAVILKEYCLRHGLDDIQKTKLAYFYSITYCCASALYLLRDDELIRKDPTGYGIANKHRIIFQSDRKYIKMRDCFEQTLRFYCSDWEKIYAPTREALSSSRINLPLWVNKVSRWPQFGRFSAFLFLETLQTVLGCGYINGTITWKDGNTATSGLLNLFGHDKEADAFDRGKFKPKQETLDGIYRGLLAAIRAYGGDDNTTKVETSLCAYRKFYKGSRYNGFYLDRILAEINELEASMPDICKELLEIRAKCFDSIMLGEVRGWKGIRKEEKKRYLLEGTMYGLNTM